MVNDTIISQSSGLIRQGIDSFSTFGFWQSFDDYECAELAIANPRKQNVNNFENPYWEITKAEAIEQFGSIWKTPVNYKITDKKSK